MGVSLVRSAADYNDALATAFNHTDEALVETFVALGREVRCGIIVRTESSSASPWRSTTSAPVKPIRLHDDKIGRDDAGDLHLVAKDGSRAWIVDPDDPLTERVWDAARRCHVALGCRHYSLFDFRIDPMASPGSSKPGSTAPSPSRVSSP